MNVLLCEVPAVRVFGLSCCVLVQVEAPPLSPFPSIRQQAVSPRRISQQHSVFVSPHKNGACLTPRTALLYKFNGSPSKVQTKTRLKVVEKGLIVF